MDLVESDITKATQILVEMGINKSNANELTSKYSKLYRRMKLDIQHEFESKSLALRQRLESEILDFSESNITSPNKVINSTNLLSMPTSPQSILLNLGNISIQNSQIIHSEIAQIVGGDITYNENDQRLIELFEQYVDHFEAINLRTSLEQLKDESTPKDERLTAKQKIVAFLYKILPKIGEKAIDILMDYIIKTSVGL
jgi:hypothetical protein